MIPSILTLFVPLACRNSFGAALVIRCMIGFFESASFPACYHFFPIWIPGPEKTLMIPAIASGMYLGEIIGFSLSGVFVGWPLHINGEYWGGWQLVFYVFGLSGIVWFPYWIWFAYESPETHPYITNEEKQLIKAGRGYQKLKSVDTDSKYHNLLTVDEVPIVEYRYTTPSMEGENPIVRYSFSGTPHESTDKTHFAIESVESPTHNPLNSNTISDNEQQQQRTTSEVEREENAKRIPWYNFFTNPVSLTLFLNNWTYVSHYSPLIYLNTTSSNVSYLVRASLASLCYQKCLLSSQIF